MGQGAGARSDASKATELRDQGKMKESKQLLNQNVVYVSLQSLKISPALSNPKDILSFSRQPLRPHAGRPGSVAEILELP